MNKQTPFQVIVNYYDGDIEWVKRLVLPAQIYYKERPEFEPFSAINKCKSETNLLKLIVDFYDDLPQVLIIVHQYERKWYHSGSLVEILNNPLLPDLFRQSPITGFHSLNYRTIEPLITHFHKFNQSGWWYNCMLPYLGAIENYGDFTNGKAACAQFMVSRENIHHRPREFYAKMYDWMVANVLTEESVGYNPFNKTRLDRPTDILPNSEYVMSRFLEWTWELIFTALPVAQPSMTIDLKPAPTASSIIELNGHQFSARYGGLHYWRDVTWTMIKHFWNPYRIEILAATNLNQVFQSTMSGHPQVLIVTIDGLDYQVGANRSDLRVSY